MAETKRYQYFAMIDKPNHPENPNRKPRRTSFKYINSMSGKDPVTGEIFREECEGVYPSDTGIYTVDMESKDAKLKLAAMVKAVRDSVDVVIGPYDTLTQVVIEQKARQPLTVPEQLAKSQAREKEKDARIKELELKNKEKTQGDR